MYRFRNTPSRGCRYSIYVQRFTTEHGTVPVLEWFHTLEDARQAAAEMAEDGRFYGIHSYTRSQETADAS